MVVSSSPLPLLLASWCGNCPRAAVGGTRRRTRIIAVAMAFVAGYYYFLAFDYRLGHPDPIIAGGGGDGDGDGAPNANNNNKPKVRIFYNLFTKSAVDEDRVRLIVEEQFAFMNPELHDVDAVSVTSIGHRIPSLLPLPNNARIDIDERHHHHHHHHHDEGGEELTLHSLWEYCRIEEESNNKDDHPNDDVKVVYLHSKGSYHPTEANRKLRTFVTRGALSSECANLPDTCDVCSSRMSPLPHPHTSGNMWLARCSYVSKLIDPLAIMTMKGMLPDEMREENPCRGRGRYLGEHWIHSHPTVKPCDLYGGKEFTWAHLRVPPSDSGSDWKPELEMAPRFTFDEYVLPGMCADEHPETLDALEFVNVRRENYELLYNTSYLEEDWWGWEFLKRSIV